MYLEKEDVSLYYELQGEGDLLILIHGVIVDADLYSSAARLLSRYFRVLTYDRRGNSRSVCKGEPHFNMEDQIQDLLDLMSAAQADTTYIVGTSAGALVGEYFLEKYPQKVRHLIMYEPAIMGFLDDMPNVHAWTNKMKKLIEDHKYNSAIMQFVHTITSYDERSPTKSPEEAKREMGNHEYALTKEFPEMAAYHPDIEKMREAADKITLAMGEKSTDPVYIQGLARLAQAVGKDVLFYPGFHNLPYDLPREFAVNVLGTLMLS